MKRCVAIVSAIVFVGAALASEQAGIVVTGDRAPDNRHMFQWTVRNVDSAPINTVTVPHYLGVIVHPPRGWEEAEMTGNISELQDQEPGIVKYRAISSMDAIRRGGELTFGLQLNLKWEGTVAAQPVTVGLVDGSEVVIGGVKSPAKEPFLRTNFPLVGLGAMFVIFLAVKAIRSKKKAAEKPASSS